MDVRTAWGFISYGCLLSDGGWRRGWDGQDLEKQQIHIADTIFPEG